VNAAGEDCGSDDRGNPGAVDLRRLVLFFGDASDAAARVYAELPSMPTQSRGHGTQLCGELVGPECRFAQTLSARIPLRDCGAGESLLAEAVVPDPCFWTPELPMMYRAKLGFKGQGSRDREAAVERWIGIRRLAVRGNALVLDQKRWVARAVRIERVGVDDLKAARDAWAGICAAAPDDEVCLEASRQGVPLLVDLTGGVANLADEVRRLGQWPAVFSLLFNAKAAVDASIRAAARNVLFGVQLTNQNDASPSWAQVVFCDVDVAEDVARSDGQLPIVVCRRAAADGVRAARGACDQLQYDVAPLGDFAGFLV
jgi:hypothetical protein